MSEVIGWFIATVSLSALACFAAALVRQRNEARRLRARLNGRAETIRRMQDALKLCIGMNSSVNWGNVRESEVDGYLREVERLKTITSHSQESSDEPRS